MWKNKRVFVTGAGGFIASHLIESLTGAGAKVTAFTRYNSRNDQGLLDCLAQGSKKRIKVIWGDLRDYDAVYDGMKGHDVVFHLAALIAIPYSYIHPKEVIETNVIGTYNVMNAAKRLKVKKVVHTSTSEVYGTAITVPISESHPLQGQSPYSASKIGADKIAESFYRSFGLPVATIRPFNCYGPRQSARAIIPAIISQGLTLDKICLGSLIPKRDLTYVSDTVEGFLKIAESEKSVGEVINIGSGFEISMGDLAKKIIFLLGRKVKIISDKKRIRPSQSEVGRLLADNSKAKKLLGWQPKISLDSGLKFTIDWVKDNLGLYNPDKYCV